jgi:2,3-bisphosphoglycerate-independent phosphoglycerate mutase
MDDKKVKLQESIRKSLAKQAADFLVPFISSIVNILTSPKINSFEVKTELKKLKIKNIRTKGDQIESFSKALDFNIYILYAGARNYILKVEGRNHYSGFSFMETNKGIMVHDNVSEDSKMLASDLKILFTKNYKHPYPVTDIFLDFINSKSS